MYGGPPAEKLFIGGFWGAFGPLKGAYTTIGQYNCKGFHIIQCQAKASKQVSKAACLCMATHAYHRALAVRYRNSFFLEICCQLSEPDTWTHLDDIF